MNAQDELASAVLECANRVSGLSLSLPPDEDLALAAFGFDSLSLFAFILELERACGISFDETLHHHERLDSIRSVATLIASSGLRQQPPSTDGLRRH